jgi:hypothetical protein
MCMDMSILENVGQNVKLLRPLMLAFASGNLVITFADAETFDYDGSALIECVCPAPAAQEDCGVKDYQDHRYSRSIAVRAGPAVDLMDWCVANRDRNVCCDQLKSRYRGDLSLRCPGRSTCEGK